MGRATTIEVLIREGRAYPNMTDYLTLKVRTDNLMDIANLKYKYGGNSYPHCGSYFWILSQRDDLFIVYKEVVQFIEDNGIECPEPLQPLIHFFARQSPQ